jgi:hypothetical protein
MTYVDRAEIAETFADSLEYVVIDQSVLRLEFVVNRMDKPKGPQGQATGKKYTACRVVLPAMQIIEIANKLSGILGAMQAKGIIQVTPVAPANTAGKPN